MVMALPPAKVLKGAKEAGALNFPPPTTFGSVKKAMVSPSGNRAPT
jgi:hypothetical protein